MRALLPPAPRPVRSSRFTHRRAPPGSSGPRSSGVGNVARRDPRDTRPVVSASGASPQHARADGRRQGAAWRPKTDWNPVLRAEFAKPYWSELQAFVRAERERHRVYPPPDEVFAALHLTPYADTRVRDPRPGPVPRAGPGPRPVLLGPRRRRPPAVARQHLQGAERRPRHPAAATTATSSRGPARACCCSTRR